MKKTNNKILKALCLAMAVIMTAGTLSSCGAEANDKGDAQDRYANANGEYRPQTQDEEDTDKQTSNEYNDYMSEMQGDIAMEDFIPNAEEYAEYAENGYKLVTDAPLSTFSVDVDTASYSNVRRMLQNGERVNPDAVRTEEFINYFSYDYPQPKEDEPVSITTELSDCPWNDEAKLMLVGLQAEEIEMTERPAMNLVFLIDVSGSMMDENKLPLVQQAFSMLAEGLDKNDRISIVTYAGEDRVVLEGETGNNYREITDALNSLEAGGATAGEAGINRAYELAEEFFIQGGNNRVILATDGDLNVGISSADELTRLVEKKRESGVYLSVLGFGTGNLKDDRLEALADNGNGNYSYIDSIDEARKVLVAEMSGTLFTVAKDVKIQLEFNPVNVAAYRLVGYENRLLDDEDFTDDKKDAGDMGAGHTVTALYEIIPAKGVLGSEGASKIALKYQENPEEEPSAEDKRELIQDDKLREELLTVKLRYKEPEEDESKEIQSIVKVSDYSESAQKNLAFAACAAEFAMYLSESEYSDITPAEIIDSLDSQGLITDDYRREMRDLLEIVSIDN
ncbi:MAG: von Willebrand factor type A domain-containing protein [Oscillospiraceae bacterium]